MNKTKIRVGCATAIALLAAGLTVFATAGPSVLKVDPASGSSAPSSPVTVCGNASLLTGPSSAPAGAVSVPAGDNARCSPAHSPRAGPTGSHRARTRSGRASSPRSTPSSNDTLIGGPGAILNGQNENDFAVAGSGTNVTVEYLTIENFTAPESQAAVNQNLSSGLGGRELDHPEQPQRGRRDGGCQRRAQQRLPDQERPVRVPDLFGLRLGPGRPT